MALPGNPRLVGHGTLAERPSLVGYPLASGLPRTGKRNPISFLALGNDLTYRDRTGTGSLTATGALRYQPGSGGRINLIKNPRFGTDTTGWSIDAGGTITRVTTDGVSALTSADVAGSTTGDGASVRTVAGAGPLRSIVAHTISFSVKNISGDGDWKVIPRTYNVAATAIQTFSTQVIAVSATWQRVTFTITPTTAGAHFLGFFLQRNNASAGVVRITDVMIEQGASASTYFDGSYPGCAWADPITGIAGTAHASPSISNAVFWVEEGTTNLVTNPWFAVNTTGWTGSNGTLSRVTTFAYEGPAAGNIAATAASATFTTSITAAAASHTAQAIVRNRAAASRTVQLKYNGANIGSPVSVAADETKTITAPFTGTGGAANLEVVWTNSANTENFVLYYAGAEAKASATSPCPAIDTSGTIQGGYTWAGTAHASASTRAAASRSILNPPAPVSIAYRFSEDGGASWQNGYRVGVGALGTNGLIAVAGSDLAVSSSRSLQIGPLAGFDRQLTAAEQSTLAAADPAAWWTALRTGA